MILIQFEQQYVSIELDTVLKIVLKGTLFNPRSYPKSLNPDKKISIGNFIRFEKQT